VQTLEAEIAGEKAENKDLNTEISNL